MELHALSYVFIICFIMEIVLGAIEAFGEIYEFSFLDSCYECSLVDPNRLKNGIYYSFCAFKSIF
jgi:hypothetical protein